METNREAARRSRKHNQYLRGGEIASRAKAERALVEERKKQPASSLFKNEWFLERSGKGEHRNLDRSSFTPIIISKKRKPYATAEAAY